MNRRSAALIAAVALLGAATAGCSADVTPAASPTAPAPATTSATPTPTPTAVGAAPSASAGSLPARAEMDEVTRILAAGTFVRLLADEPGLGAVSDDEKTAAGDAMCDAMDRGDSFQSVLIVGAGMLPAAETTDAVAAVLGVAAGTLCPEHAGYAGG